MSKAIPTINSDAKHASKIDAVIYQIHAASHREGGWSLALEGMRELLHGQLATLAKYHFLTGRGEKLVVTPSCDEFRTAYAAEYAVRNPWFFSSQDYPAGRVMSGEELLHPDELQRSDFYQRFLRRYNLLHRLCGVLLREDDIAYYLALYRSPQQPAFDSGDKATLQILLRHCSLAFTHERDWLRTHSLQQAIQTVVDRISMAVFLVDTEARVVFSNQAAEQLLVQHDGLTLRDNCVRATVRTENRALLEAIEEMAAADNPAGAESFAAESATKIITLLGARKQPPLVVTVRAIGNTRSSQLGSGQSLAALVINNPATVQDSHDCALTQLYQLTPAQTRLTTLIVAGHTLAHAARELKVSENTVRSHLKQIFQKTETHSQMELVHLHTRICIG